MSDNCVHVVFLNQSSGYLQVDIINAWRAKGYDCTLITGGLDDRDNVLDESVNIHYVIQYSKESGFSRLLSWVICFLQMAYLTILKYRSSHIVAVSNPPFTALIPYLLRLSYDVVLFDIYPDLLINYNLIKENGLIHKLYASINKVVFKRASRVITLTPEMGELTAKYLSVVNRAEVIPPWSNFQRNVNFIGSEKFGTDIIDCKDQFVLVYSGNLGRSHPIDKLIELVAHLDSRKFLLVIIGNGYWSEYLQEKILRSQLTNIRLMQRLPFIEYRKVLEFASMSVVLLDSRAESSSIPSKTFDILAAGKPILAICSAQSSLANLLNSHECGIVIDFNNYKYFKEILNRLFEDKILLDKLGYNSKIASSFFTSALAEKYVSKVG